MLLVHIPKFRIGAGKILANASTPDFSGTSDIIWGYALNKFWIRFSHSAFLAYVLIFYCGGHPGDRQCLAPPGAPEAGKGFP
jgi:hypothetical protein